MLPPPVFRHLDRRQLADYFDALTVEIARTRARLFELDRDHETKTDRLAALAKMRADHLASRPAPSEALKIAVSMARRGAPDCDIAARLGQSTRTVRRLLHRAWTVE